MVTCKILTSLQKILARYAIKRTFVEQCQSPSWAQEYSQVWMSQQTDGGTSTKCPPFPIARHYAISLAVWLS